MDYNKQPIQEAYQKILDKEKKLDEGSLKSKILSITKTFMEVRRDTLAAQKELDDVAQKVMTILTDNDIGKVKMDKLLVIRKNLNDRTKRTRPVLKKLYYDVIDQIDDAINMYKQFPEA